MSLRKILRVWIFRTCQFRPQPTNGAQLCQILIPAANSHAHDRRVLADDGDRRICAHLRVHRNARHMIFTALLDHHGDWEFSTHGGLVIELTLTPHIGLALTSD